MTSKKCSSKLVSKAVSKAFKRIFHHNKVSMINHISILQIKNYSIFQLFQLLIFPSPFLNKLKRLVIKLIKSYLDIWLFHFFILNYLILIWLVCWMVSLNSHLSVVIKKYILVFLELELFGVINLNTQISLLRNGVVLVSLLLTLNIFYTLIYCFYC